MTRLLAGVALILVASHALGAQSARPASIDFTVGASGGSGGNYTARGGFAGEVTFVPDHNPGRIVAFTFGARGSPVSNDLTCVIGAPGSSCLRHFPALVNAGLLGGLERATPGLTLRALVGPGVFAGNGSPGLGAQLQFDAAAGRNHVAFVLAARGSAIVRSSGEKLGLGSLQFGLRFR